MPRYRVTVQFTQVKEKEINVFGKDEEAAMEKACEIVSGWPDVDDCDAINCDEE